MPSFCYLGPSISLFGSWQQGLSPPVSAPLQSGHHCSLSRSPRPSLTAQSCSRRLPVAAPRGHFLERITFPGKSLKPNREGENKRRFTESVPTLRPRNSLHQRRPLLPGAPSDSAASALWPKSVGCPADVVHDRHVEAFPPPNASSARSTRLSVGSFSSARRLSSCPSRAPTAFERPSASSLKHYHLLGSARLEPRSELRRLRFQYHYGWRSRHHSIVHTPIRQFFRASRHFVA